jgi:hypothetical protein
MSAATLKAVLKNRTLRWSSPVLFNDPFDVPKEILYEIGTDEILDATVRTLASVLEDPPSDMSQFQPYVQEFLEGMNGLASRPDRKAVIATLKKCADGGQLTRPLEELRVLWRTWITQFRILCLCESAERVSMWYHYADRYTGSVLEFSCNDKTDSVFLAAEPVSYSDETPEMLSVAGWARALMMPVRAAFEELLKAATYSKSPDWSYENEWRLTSFDFKTDGGLYTDTRFDPRDLAGVYFGPLISAEDKAEVRSLAASFPNVRMFEMSIGMHRKFTIREIGK